MSLYFHLQLVALLDSRSRCLFFTVCNLLVDLAGKVSTTTIRNIRIRISISFCETTCLQLDLYSLSISRSIYKITLC